MPQTVFDRAKEFLVLRVLEGMVAPLEPRARVVQGTSLRDFPQLTRVRLNKK